MAESDSEAPWLPLSEAARRLGRHPDGIRSMIRRGRVNGRKGNAGQWLVQVPTESDPVSNGHDSGVAESLADLREELTEARVAAARFEAERDTQASAHTRERETLQAVIGDLRTERDRLAAELADARKGWIVRMLEALRRR
jgi:hypothetical protein